MTVTPDGEVLMTTLSAGAIPAIVEIYNQNAILTERVELPKSIQSLKRVCRTPSGNYIGFGEQHLCKFWADGSTVCQTDITKYPDIGSCVKFLEVSPYHVFLISLPSADQWGFKISLITSDLAFQRTLLGSKEESVSGVCYAKATKRLAVLKYFQVKVGHKMELRKGVTVYNVF